MANYKISDTTLTSIGDALRRKHGENIITYAPDTVDNSFDIYELPLSSYGNSSALTKNIYLQLKKSTNIKFVYNANIENARIRISGFDRLGTIIGYEDLVNGDNEISVYSDDMCVMIQITFNRDDYTNNTAVANYSGTFYFYKNDELLTKEVATLNTYKPGEMAQAIDDIPPAPTDEELMITGNCQYRFANGGWDWVINKYGDKITTKDITDASSMFKNTQINEIPFEINFKNGGGSCSLMFSQATKLTSIPSIDFKHNNTYNDIGSLFDTCNEVKEIGTLKNLYPNGMSSIFNYNRNLRYLPKFENLNLSRVQTYSYAGYGSMFNYCYSLREIPEEFLKQLYGIQTTYTYLIYYDLRYCYSLDELKGLSPRTGALTSNAFSYALRHLSRVKDIIFDIQDDGTPYSANWKSQTIDLTQNIGYLTDSAVYRSYILNYNSGITADKEVKDDATYQALKDNPDWFTCKVEYSRYNHDSAVNTINSLPIITATGTTNTIKFNGAAGSKTDGGAINTLTAEEIAVASSKGWTVSFA